MVAGIHPSPETVVCWHRTGFKSYWTRLWRHRTRAGRKCVSSELRALIFRMVHEDTPRGAPRVRGELKKLGFYISERTVLRWMRKAPRNSEPAKQWGVEAVPACRRRRDQARLGRRTQTLIEDC